ncbi:NACHT domain-containing protein [Saccharopolyspora taberi]|uniref:NACHT domain-containing protein n=1 Tax=Saccharopolyspora taberi TaxID=60895 RepID=UPI0031E33C18
MAAEYEIHNHSSGPAGTNVQFGVNKGTIWFVGSPARSSAEDAREGRLRDLAAEVRSACDRELEKWGLRDRDALPVRWHTATDDLFDHWTKIQDDGAPVSLDGRFTTIRHTYETVESRRLVILGRAGAGKTVLAHRLILDLLTNNPTGPVPVLFSLGDWNPATELRAWLAEHLARDFLFLDTPDVAGKKLAEVFVERGLILPVLDGFDEIPADHHPSAIRQISTLDLPLILTSRPGEYSRAAHEIKAIGGAAAITLEDLTLDETHQYLRQSTGKRRGPAWDAVFNQLRTAPDEPANRNLTAMLTMPLMVMLARTVYNDNQGLDPGELLNIERFPTAMALEDHLLDAYLTTVYTRRTRRTNWDSDQARRWLGYIATHLTQRDTHDLTWWNLPATLHRRSRILITTVVVGLAVGIVYGLAVRPAIGPLVGLTAGITVGIAVGPVGGLAVGLTNEVGFSRGPTGREPERLRLSLRRRAPKSLSWLPRKRSVSEFTSGVAVGVGLGLGYGLAFGLALALGGEIGIGIAIALTFGITIGIAIGIANGLAGVVVSAFGDAYDLHATDPWTLLNRDRTITLARTAAAAVLTMALVVGIATGIGLETARGLLFGLGFGLVIAPVRLAFSAWGSWLLFTRLWLPLTCRLPWRLKRFLVDAYDRGVLRRAGSAYQFRHARLRDHLAAQGQS